MSMPTYCLEMRSTENWDDVRYREYTTSERKIAAFKAIPKIQFTDSGHGVVPVITAMGKRKRERVILSLKDYVMEKMGAAND
jgi:hypothetical protein